MCPAAGPNTPPFEILRTGAVVQPRATGTHLFSLVTRHPAPGQAGPRATHRRGWAASLLTLALAVATLSACRSHVALPDIVSPASPSPHARTPIQRASYCSNCDGARRLFREICDFAARERTARDATAGPARVIFTNGYHMRNLVAGYRIFDEPRYLDVAVAYADHLVRLQSNRGYWGTGYGDIYLADTASALGLLVVLQRHVDPDRQHTYADAIGRHLAAIEADGLILPSGAIGTGWRTDGAGRVTGPYRDEYTISSALTGGTLFMWMYRRRQDEHYQHVAYRALRWILTTMRSDGAIPYVLAGEGGHLGKTGDAKNDYVLWQRARYLTSAYVGEGVVAFDLHSNDPRLSDDIRRRIGPHVDFVLRTQRQDGIWEADAYRTDHDRTWDRTRAAGIINLLIWYHRHVKDDPRIVTAVQRFEGFMLDFRRAQSFGLLTAGAATSPGVSFIDLEAATALVGRALADMLLPGITWDW
jgi:hypothetical protein